MELSHKTVELPDGRRARIGRHDETVTLLSIINGGTPTVSVAFKDIDGNSATEATVSVFGENSTPGIEDVKAVFAPPLEEVHYARIAGALATAYLEIVDIMHE